MTDKKPEPFHSVRQARNWLDRNGWLPRHGGGYEKPGSGYATLSARPDFVIEVEFYSEMPLPR